MKRLHGVCALVAALSLFSMPASAGWFTARIDRIQIQPTGAFLVFLHTTTTHECGSTRVDFVDPNLPAAKAILAALLAYEAQKAYVQFAINSCSGTTGIFGSIESEVGL